MPGRYTTANLLLSVALPRAQDEVEYLFSEIEDAVLKGEVDAGLLIHENRFTYERRGLKRLPTWASTTESLVHLPIPLGGIAIKRTIPVEIARKVDKNSCTSVSYAIGARIHPINI
ncbi:MAG: MqnA/MqnD/SBP family protein [Bacteroidales bacterium]